MLPMELDGRRDARKHATELLQRVGLGQRLNHSPASFPAESNNA